MLRSLPDPITVQNIMYVGDMYRVDNEPMRLIAMYTHFALFERENGQRECFLYQDLQNTLRTM